jgi:hypothetical protein
MRIRMCCRVLRSHRFQLANFACSFLNTNRTQNGSRCRSRSLWPDSMKNLKEQGFDIIGFERNSCRGGLRKYSEDDLEHNGSEHVEREGTHSVLLSNLKWLTDGYQGCFTDFRYRWRGGWLWIWNRRWCNVLMGGLRSLCIYRVFEGQRIVWEGAREVGGEG